MAVQDPMKTINHEAAWLDEAFAAGCIKKQMTRKPTAVERQNGQLEQVICEVIMRNDMVGQFFDPHGRPVRDDLPLGPEALISREGVLATDQIYGLRLLRRLPLSRTSE